MWFSLSAPNSGDGFEFGEPYIFFFDRDLKTSPLEEVLMLHKLKVPALLRQSLHSTNPIESMFSMVRSCESQHQTLP